MFEVNCDFLVRQQLWHFFFLQEKLNQAAYHLLQNAINPEWNVGRNCGLPIVNKSILVCKCQLPLEKTSPTVKIFLKGEAVVAITSYSEKKYTQVIDFFIFTFIAYTSSLLILKDILNTILTNQKIVYKEHNSMVFFYGKNKSTYNSYMEGFQNGESDNTKSFQTNSSGVLTCARQLQSRKMVLLNFRVFN